VARASFENRARRALGLGIVLAALVGLLPGAAAALVISEVMFDPTGADGDREWIEIFNDGPGAVDLSNYSLGWGVADYTAGSLALPSVTLSPGQYFLVGGPLSDAGNGSPDWTSPLSLAVDLAPNLANPFFFAAGVGLFQTGVTNPIHTVIYGPANFFLVDENGVVGPPDVTWPLFGNPPAGTSLVWNGTTWSAGNAPTPGGGSLVAVPEAGPAVLTLLGLVGLATAGSPRRRQRARRQIVRS
jgi:hypothetical protein